MLALFKGAGRLPELIIEQLAAAGTAPVVCALDPDDEAQFHVSLPRLGSLLGILRSHGVTEICMAGSIDRTTLTLGAPDAATQPLVPALQAALGGGDGQALAGLHKLLEDQGFQIRAAQELCPELLPPEGVLTQAKPTKSHEQDTAKAGATLANIASVPGRHSTATTWPSSTTQPWPRSAAPVMAMVAAALAASCMWNLVGLACVRTPSGGSNSGHSSCAARLVNP